MGHSNPIKRKQTDQDPIIKNMSLPRINLESVSHSSSVYLHNQNPDGSRDLLSGNPRVEHREVRVFGIPQTVCEVSAFDEVVDEVNVVAGDRSTEEFDDAHVVAPADDGELLPELRGLDFAAELALENDEAHFCYGSSPSNESQACAPRYL
ncbi:hypothetical protein SO802_026784 [Lithocarpus litseifolius]|uniref:Uncharacterized protein n=1 Tax=Lithocarpus litseifolius TaxID=425828 RepID=A0AAW2C3T6_9ROSI